MNNQQEASRKDWRVIFFLVWTGQAFSLIGSMLVQFALVWWVTQTTGSASALAFGTFVAMLPEIVLAPFAGALVDRWNRRLVMILADGAVALTTLVLVILFWLGGVQIWQVYLVIFFRALGGAFHYPAMSASTSLMVPEEHLARVGGINQALNGILRIATPPLGALLIGLLPVAGVLSIDILTAALAILPLLFVPIPEPERTTQKTALTPKTLWRDVQEGWLFMRQWKGGLVLMGLAALLNFVLNPVGTLMPLLITRVFQGNAGHLGIIEAGWGAGLVLGGLFLGAWGGFRKRIVTSMAGITGMGLGMLLLGLVPGNLFGLAVFSYVLVGFMNPITNGPLNAILQARVPAEMQGRIFTLVISMCSIASPLGVLLSAPVTDVFGIQAWSVAAGAACVAVGLVSFFIPLVMNLEEELEGIGSLASAAQTNVP